MNEHAQKWVEALRSGEFQQGRFGLRRWEDRYCCLGVACELYRQEVGNSRWVLSDDDDKDYARFALDGGYPVISSLPNQVKEWFKLRTGSGRYHKFSSLTEKNDNGYTFQQIAAIIESEPDGLFQEEAGR